MPAKKKKVVEEVVEAEPEGDVVLDALLERYWKLIRTEDMGKTPSVTKALDKLEASINERKAEKK